ncbi:UNVERIFIED_CONTAM: Cyclin-dependent kinase G-2 [Sesamum calycinum]|uniref:Cyclin-dependent kinase G-2 n=1 Tax=Sesamum calycinum TaxID=2727403 RepID=A0AAW2MPE6_9LAMI
MAFAVLYSCNQNDHDHHPANHSQNVIVGRADHYVYLNVISEGPYGVMFRALNKKTGEVLQSESGSYSPGVATLWYRAPEVLAGAETYSSAVDMWSVGCIMAEMLLKQVLFKGRCEIEQLHIIYMSFGIGCAKPYSNQLLRRFLNAMTLGRTPVLTQLGFDLLNRLLRFDPDKRITADEALNHGWFKEFDPYFFRNLPKPVNNRHSGSCNSQMMFLVSC